MDFKFNSCTIFINDTINYTQNWSDSSSDHPVLPKSVCIFLVSTLVGLIGQLVRQKNISKRFYLQKFAPTKRSTGISSVSLLTILKSLLMYGTDIRKIAELIMEKYRGVVKLNVLGLYNFVLITNPFELQKLYVSTEQGHLYKPTWYSKILAGPIKDGLISSPPEKWKIHRSAISKVFTCSCLLRQLNTFEEHAKRFVLKLQETCNSMPCSNKPVMSFENQVDMLIFEIILHIAAGKEVYNASQEDKTRFHNNLQKVEDIISYRFHNPLNLFDFIWKFNPLKKDMDDRLKTLYDYSNKFIAESRQQFDASTNKGLNTCDDMAGKSLVEVMLKAEFSNADIFIELATLINAGHDTTRTTFKLVLFLLASRKEYQEKCQEEIDQMFEQMCASNTNEISLKAINSLNFLDMCIKECLRLYPVLPLFGRELESPLKLEDHHYLPPRTHVITSPWFIHHNPKMYPEPEKFDPERFLPEKIRDRGICDYIPFSVGPRNCIGFKSAMIEVKVLVSYVLHNFRVRSKISVDDLNQKLRKTVWPFPDLGIQIHPRH